MKRMQEQSAGTANRRPVRIHIDELVLHGFDPGERHRIAAAVQEELARLVRNEGAPASAGIASPVDNLDAGAIRIPHGSTARAAGLRIGASIYQGLQRQNRSGQPVRVTKPVPGGFQR